MTTASKPRPVIVYGESHSYPVLPLRDIVVFPHMIVPLFVGREKSVKALEEVMRADKQILLDKSFEALNKRAGWKNPFGVGPTKGKSKKGKDRKKDKRSKSRRRRHGFQSSRCI